MSNGILRKCCKYGRNCYRRNPAHRFEESHPGDEDYQMPTQEAPAGAPLCPFAVIGCYRRQPHHFRIFSHSVPTTPSVSSISQNLRLPLSPLSPSSLAQASTIDTIPIDAENEDIENVDFVNEIGVTLIKDIDPDNKEQTIKVRVTIKSDKHPFSSRFGPGELFTINVVDRSGEIRLAAYGACVDKFFDKVEVNQIYKIKKFKVKNSDDEKKSFVRVNRFNLQFNKDSQIEPITDPEMDFPRLKFHFQSLDKIASKNKDETIDVIAICREYGPLIPTKLPDKSPSQKRELVLVDQTSQVILTIWGSNAETFAKNAPGCVLALKRGRVMNKKNSLDGSCLASCTYQINPDIPEATQLLDWVKSTVISRV